MNIARNNTNEVESSRQPIAGFIKHLNDKFFRGSADVKISGQKLDWTGALAIRQFDRFGKLATFPPSEFADEVAAYYQRPRMTLPELLAVPSLVERFARRFLREAMIFPFDAGGGRFGLAVADPTDFAAQRGAEIVLGGPVAVSIASFEDIGAALFERLGSDEDGSSASSPFWLPRLSRRASTACATSPAARRSYARSMTLWKKQSSFEQATYTSNRCAMD